MDAAPVDELAALVLERTRLASSSGAIGVQVRLAQALPDHLQKALRAEAARRSWSGGVVVPSGLKARNEGRVLRVMLEPFDNNAIRLDFLTTALRFVGSTLGASLSALVVAAVATRLQELHDKGLGDGYLSPRRILVGPGGGIAVVAPGLPLLATLLQPQESKSDRLRKRAPETLLHHRATPSADVFTLGALYYEFLSGHGYRDGASTGALRTAAENRLAPELPGKLPDPRDSLVELLRGFLASVPNHRPTDGPAAQRALRKELEQAEIKLGSRHALVDFLNEYIGPKVPRGLDTLFGEDQVQPPVRPASAPRKLSSAARGPGSSAWASVLGDNVPAERGESSRPQVALGANAFARIVPRREASEDPSSSSLRLKLPSPSQEGLQEDPSDQQSDASKKNPPSSSQEGLTGLSLAESSLTDPPLPPSIQSFAPPLAAIQEGPSQITKAPTLEDAVQLSTSAKLRLAASLVAIVAIVTAIGTLRNWARPPSPDKNRIVETPKPKPTLRSNASVVPPGPKRRRPPAPARPGSRGRSRDAKEPDGALGLISIISTPMGADVALDGAHLGTTPLVTNLPLKKQSYLLRVTKKDFVDWEEVVLVKGGNLNTHARLIPQ